MFKNKSIKQQKKEKINTSGLGYLFFGFVLGVWISLYIVVQLSIDMLWILGASCMVLCFIGFLHYWMEHQKTVEQKDGAVDQ